MQAETRVNAEQAPKRAPPKPTLWGQVYEGEVGELSLEPVGGTLAAMDGAVVDDPEDALGRTIGLHGHHLGDEGVEGDDGDLADDLAEEAGPVHVPGRDVGADSVAPVFVLDANRAADDIRTGSGHFPPPC